MSGISKVYGEHGIESVKVPCAYDPKDSLLVANGGDCKVLIRARRIPRNSVDNADYIGIMLDADVAIEMFSEALAVAHRAKYGPKDE